MYAWMNASSVLERRVSADARRSSSVFGLGGGGGGSCIAGAALTLNDDGVALRSFTELRSERAAMTFLGGRALPEGRGRARAA